MAQVDMEANETMMLHRRDANAYMACPGPFHTES